MSFDDRKQREDELDARLTCALERPLTLQVPADFAARVAARVPTRPRPMAIPQRGAAGAPMRVLWTALLVLLVMLFALAPGAAHSAPRMLVEWALAAELAGLAVWIGRGAQQRT